MSYFLLLKVFLGNSVAANSMYFILRVNKERKNVIFLTKESQDVSIKTTELENAEKYMRK